jgi:hypothetical protein
MEERGIFIGCGVRADGAALARMRVGVADASAVGCPVEGRVSLLTTTFLTLRLGYDHEQEVMPILDSFSAGRSGTSR